MMDESVQHSDGPNQSSRNLELCLGKSVQPALAALEKARHQDELATIQTVVLKNNYKGISQVTPEDLVSLLETLGKACRGIETLKVSFEASSSSSSRSQPLALPVAALAVFLQQAPQQLQSLVLTAPLSATSSHDFVLLEQAIQKYAPATWKEVRLEFCEPATGTKSLDPLVKALASISSLEELALSGTDLAHGGICTGPSLRYLVQGCNHLRSLAIYGGRRSMQADDVVSLVRALHTNTSLKELTLHAKNLCQRVGRAIAQCLVVNQSLERLVLNVGDSSACLRMDPTSLGDYVVTTTRIAEALRVRNRSLKVLSVDYSYLNPVDVVGMEQHLSPDVYQHAELHASAEDYTRKCLNVKAVLEAFTKMLRQNHVLETLWVNNVDAATPCVTTILDECPEDEEDETAVEDEEEDLYQDQCPRLLTSEMEMLLRLNRFGIRSNLFNRDHVTSNDWVDALLSQKDDLSALHYLISKNPSICATLRYDDSTNETSDRKRSREATTESDRPTKLARQL